MQNISDTVGENGRNKNSDVALIEAILLKTKRAPTSLAVGVPFLTSYGGTYTKATATAIRAFQDDYVFVSKDGKQCAPDPTSTTALVKADDGTWKKLLQFVDKKFSDMHVLDDGKTVYVAATDDDLADRIKKVDAFTFTPAFKTKVLACINEMYRKHKIAVGVCPQGGRRNFQEQYDILMKGDGSTHAGPGESNHNFGMAVDISFKGLRWLKKEGAVEENEGPWLAVMNKISSTEALVFWKALRAVGTAPPVSAFRGPESDRPHLQNWADANVDMARSLASLLSRVGRMRWSGQHQHYYCDLGFGGQHYPVGSAERIWNHDALVTITGLTQARQAVRPHAVAHGHRAPAQPGMRQQMQAPGQPQAPADPPVSQMDVVAMKRALRSDFDAADGHWQDWLPA